MTETLTEVAPGVRIHCATSGTGPALLLMHGAEADHRMFAALRPHLEPRFTVIAYAQRDCGATESPPTAATLADLADDAHALLVALGHRSAHVFGSSFGGRVAQFLAHRHPSSVQTLVLGSTWALPTHLADHNPAIADIQALRAALPESASALVEYFLPATFLAERPDLRDLFRRAPPPQSARAQRRAAAVADQPAVPPAAISARCLVLAGGEDRVVPPTLTLQLAQALRAERTVLLDGVGHATVLQAPERVAAELVSFCLGATA